MIEKNFYFDISRKRVVETGAKNLPETFFRPLSSSQLDFYRSNPGASYKEVFEEKLSVFDLASYKAWKIDELSALSLIRQNELIPDYQFRNAVTGVYTEETTPKKSEVLNKIERIGTALRGEFYRLKPLIMAAGTSTDVDNVFSSNNFNLID